MLEQEIDIGHVLVATSKEFEGNEIGLADDPQEYPGDIVKTGMAKCCFLQRIKGCNDINGDS